MKKIVIPVLIVLLILAGLVYHGFKIPGTGTGPHKFGVSPSGNGVFVVTNCNSITNPVTNGTWCLNASAGTASYWNGSSYIPLSGLTGPQGSCNSIGQIEGGVYDVMCPAFGAKNDFVDDDTTAIQNAVYAACHTTPPATPDSSVPKGPLYFPPNEPQGANGLYLHTQPIRVTCGNLEMYGHSSGATIGVHNTSAFFQNYYGPAFIFEAYGTNTLQYTTGLVGGGSALTTTGCSGSNCGTLQLSDLVGFFGPNKINGNGQLSIELYFKPTTPHIVGQVNQILSATAGSIATSNNVSFNIQSQFDSDTLQGKMDINGSVKTVTGPTLSSGTTYRMSLDYDGTTLRFCSNDTLINSTAATGNVTQNPFEMITVPDQSQANWPDAYGAVGTTWPGVLDSIRISNIARHASSCTMSTSSKLTSDANTLLLLNFDNTNGSDIKPWQTVTFGSSPTTAYLPIHGTNSGYEVASMNVHDLGLGGPLFAIWSPDSLWERLSASSNSQIPAFDFNEDDWLNITRDLYAYSANAVGFEFGSRYNEGHNINPHVETSVHGIGYMSISNGGTQDDHIVVQVASDQYWPLMFINTQAILNFPFADLESSDSNWQGWMYTNGNFGNIQVNNAQITTFNNQPYITLNCNSGAPVILNGADFGATSNSSEIFHFISSNCNQGIPQVINATSLPTGGAALSDAAGKASMSPCTGSVTLSSGSGTFSNLCIQPNSICSAIDTTTFSHSVTLGAPSTGSVALSGGTGSDVIRVNCQ